jgi:hypothetical protein
LLTLAGVGCVTLGWIGLARGETFVFRDAAQGKARGKVLAEFEDTLFVVLDGRGTEFLSRAELSAIEGDDGQRFEAPQPGTFARFAGAAPAGAVTDAHGEVYVQGPGDEAGAALGEGYAFVRAGDRVKTADDALGRLLLASNAELKLGAGAEVVLTEPVGRERIKLARGELFVATRLRPLELALGSSAAIQVQADTRLEASAGGGKVGLLLHHGRAEVVWADARLVLSPGHGAELLAAGPAEWRVVADAANVGDLQVHLPEGTERVAPGESRSFGAHVDREGLVWRLLTSKGELLVRRAGEDDFAEVRSDERELFVLGEGDELRTAVKGSATLGRIDGAAVSLESVSHVRVTAVALDLSKGALHVESVASPVKVKTPGGVAGLRQSIVRLARRDASTLEVACQAGSAEVPLGDLGAVRLETRAEAELTAPPEGAARVRVSKGQGRLLSRAPRRGFDPDVQVVLRQDDEVGLEADEEGRPVLHLPGTRWLRLDGPGIGAEVSLTGEHPLIRFESGSEVVMLAGLRMGLGRSQEVPQLRFRSGPRLRLAHPYRLQVHNPTAVIEGRDGSQSTLELDGELDAQLDQGGQHAVASLSVREGDRLELLGGAHASLKRMSDQHRYDVGDGRQLWIQDGAPPVQARLSDAQGTAYLTMPGAPALGLAAGRQIIVLATVDGEFVVVSADDVVGADELGLQGLVGPGALSPVERIASSRMRDMLDVPQLDSPSGP